MRRDSNVSLLGCASYLHYMCSLFEGVFSWKELGFEMRMRIDDSYCGQSSRRLIAGNERLQKRKSTLTGGSSGGDPPTVKSER